MPKEEEVVDLQIAGVEIYGFAFRHLPENIFVDQYQIQADLTFQVDASFEHLRVLLWVRVHPEDEALPAEKREEFSDYPLAKIDTGTIFTSEGLDRIIDEEKPLPPHPVLKEISQVAIDTTRGVLIEKLRGTHLEGAIMPLIDIAALDLDSLAKEAAERLGAKSVETRDEQSD